MEWNDMLSIIETSAVHTARVVSRSTAQPSNSTTHARELQRQILLWGIWFHFWKQDCGRKAIWGGTSDFSLCYSMRGRSRLRWVDCNKKALERNGEELRTTATDRRDFRVFLENTGKEKGGRIRERKQTTSGNHGQLRQWWQGFQEQNKDDVSVFIAVSMDR